LKPALSGKSNVFCARKLLLLAVKGEDAQYKFLQENFQDTDNIILLCAKLNFYLNPTKRHFSIQVAEQVFERIMQYSHIFNIFQNGDVFVLGLRLYVVKGILNTLRAKEEVKNAVAFLSYPPNWLAEWMQALRFHQPSDGYFWAMFKVTEDDYAHKIYQQAFHFIQRDTQLYKHLYYTAYKRSFNENLVTTESLQVAERFQNFSRFGDFYRYVPTSTRRTPLREKVSDKRSFHDFIL
jgi:hypothetical protein